MIPRSQAAFGLHGHVKELARAGIQLSEAASGDCGGLAGL
jgi:hypothetical protein